MKKTALIMGFIVCIAVVSANSSSAGDVWPVGAVIQSVMNEDDFQAQMGAEWVLMDGRPVSKSDEISPYLDGTTDASGNILLPNAQGKFLRMMDYRDAAQRAVNGDPEDNRILGGYQRDTFKEHTHLQRTNRLASANAQGAFAYAGAPGKNAFENVSNMLQNTGDLETRPKNIAMNFFIKIRKCQSAECK